MDEYEDWEAFKLEFLEDDIDLCISEANKKELIDYLHQGYDICIGSNYITLSEIFKGRKRLTEDDIRTLPETDEDYSIEIDESVKYIEIWL